MLKMTNMKKMVSVQGLPEQMHTEPRSMLLPVFLGLSVVSLVTSFSLLAAAVFIH
jgi:hypothetical protein